MSLKLKLGGTLLIVGMVLLTLIVVLHINTHYLTDIKERRRAEQVLAAISEGLPLVILTEHPQLLKENALIEQLQKNTFLMQTAIKTSLQLEQHEEIRATLIKLQADLMAVTLLLENLTHQFSHSEPIDFSYLKFDQLKAITHDIETFAAVYDEYLQVEEAHVLRKSEWYTLFASTIMVVTVLFTFFILYLSILRPIVILSRSTEETANGNYEHPIHIPNKDELGKLANSFIKMNQKLKKSFERLEQQNTDLLRMHSELEITRRLQQMILPKEEDLKKIKDLDIASFMEAATEVGGDYYDVLQYNGHVKIGIGDVTGHGLESGVLMLMVQMAVRTLLTHGMTSPENFLNIINRAIYDNVKRMDSDKNLTLCLLDYRKGTIHLTGQHEDVLLVRQGGKIERIDTTDLGFIVGIKADISRFTAQLEICLQPGDGLVLYTDGITEAFDESDAQYGIDRLCEMVSQYWHLTASEIQKAIITDVRRHVNLKSICDDITLLVLKQR